MAYVVVLSTSQSCNSADTKWSPPTNVTPIRMTHHTPKRTLEYALYISHQAKYFLLQRMKEDTRTKSHTASGASRRRKRGRELAEPHSFSLDLVSGYYCTMKYVHTVRRMNFGSRVVYSPKLDCKSRAVLGYGQG